MAQSGTCPHKQHSLTEVEQIARAGADNGVHQQSQTQQVMKQVTGWRVHPWASLMRRTKGDRARDKARAQVQRVHP